jgi:hypothetical protein
LVGYQINRNLSVGADANYNFGSTSFEYINGVPVGTRELNSADLSGVNFNFGMMYQTKVYKKYQFVVVYSLESTLKSKNTEILLQ